MSAGGVVGAAGTGGAGFAGTGVDGGVAVATLADSFGAAVVAEPATGALFAGAGGGVFSNGSNGAGAGSRGAFDGAAVDAPGLAVIDGRVVAAAVVRDAGAANGDSSRSVCPT